MLWGSGLTSDVSHGAGSSRFVKYEQNDESEHATCASPTVSALCFVAHPPMMKACSQVQSRSNNHPPVETSSIST